MVELDIIRVVTSVDTNPKLQTPMQEINDAYKACQFGKFHIKLIGTSFVGAIAGVLVTSTTSYLLPEAECHLDMDLLDKGLLNAAPFIGMMTSSVLAGFLIDTFGRKRFLIIGYSGIFLFSIMAGSSQSYEVLLSAKYFEGLLFAASISAHVTYVSEFCHRDIRDRVLIFKESFGAVSQIICPLMTWGILIQDWKYTLFDGYFELNTWNFYLYIMSLWSLFACMLYSMLPESPKYLVTRQKYEEAREILIEIYKENTGKPAETYPYIDIWKNIEIKDVQSEKGSKSITHQLAVGLHNVKPIFRKPLVSHLAILSSAMFMILAIYNIVRLWFPQLSTIVEHYKTDGSQDLCVLLDSYTSDLKSRGESSSNSTSDICIPTKIGSETYINSIIIGFVCLIPYLITGAVVNRVGKKALLFIFGAISVGVTLGLRWASSKTAMVALFAADTAISQLMKGLNLAVAVELFPTEIRSLTLSLILTCGRLGTLSGNIGFPLLLDMGCVIPFYTMSGMMMCGDIPAKSRLPIQEINSAYQACHFGLFHIKLLAIASTAFIAGVLVSNTTSYLLPSAECDLHMSLVQKGLLNAIPYVGTLLPSVVAGFLTDTFGRKIFVVYGYGGIFVFTLIAGTSQTYELLITAKFLEGILFGAAFSAVLTLTSEFCHNEIRDRVMLCQSSFGAIAQILVPLMSWLVLTNDWKYELFGGMIVLNTWNFYLYAMSLWSLMACLLYTFFLPESPKFLITHNRYDEARDILIKIYMTNTGKPADTYPYVNIWNDKVKQTLHELPEEEIKMSFLHQISMGLANIKPMFHKPLVGYLVLICVMNFFVMALYNVNRLWFPQLSTIVEHYKVDDNQDLCAMLDTYTEDLRIKDRNYNASDVCIATKSGTETYINSIILGCVGLVPFCVTGILVNRVGKKPLFIVSSLITMGTVLGTRWANTKAAIVALFSVSTALAQLLMSLNQALTLEVFPTTTRTLAISLMMFFGRIGALTGNITFPILLDMACVIPFYTMSGMMIGLTCLTLFIPKRKPQ